MMRTRSSLTPTPVDDRRGWVFRAVKSTTTISAPTTRGNLDRGSVGSATSNWLTGNQTSLVPKPPHWWEEKGLFQLTLSTPEVNCRAI